MDFSSIPAYLDPSNWQQTPPQLQQQQQHQQQQTHVHHHHHHQHGGGSNLNPNNNNNNSNPLLPPPPLPPPLQSTVHGHAPQAGPMGGSIRPGSMAERARMANIPMPEPALKCPRCESTNTKFCYFNNYSLSQPRHFCKTCRRYWTRGGALRSVPVGGGCRRNKRSKSTSSSAGAASSSKSAASDRDRPSSAAAASSANSALSGGMPGTSSMEDILGLTPPPPLSALRFMSPFHHVSDFGGYGGLTAAAAAGDLGFQLGGMEHQWRLPGPPQLPYLGGLDSGAAVAGGSGLYGHPFDGVEFSSLGIGHVRSKGLDTTVKTEGSGGGARQEMSSSTSGANLARQFNLGMLSQHGNVVAGEHFNWGGSGGGGIGGGSSSSGGGGNANAWTDMSGVNNSSCSTTSAM